MPKPRHVHEIYVKAPAERVWQAITDPENDRGLLLRLRRAVHMGAGRAVPLRHRWDGCDRRGDQGNRAWPQAGDVVHDGVRPRGRSRGSDDGHWGSSPRWATRLSTRSHHQDFHGPTSKTWSNTLTGWTHIISGLKTLVETGEPLGDIPDDRAGQPAADIDGELHREQAITANNSTWDLLSQDVRSADEDEDMVRRAYAAAYHWTRATRRSPVNEARASWLLSRVHSVLGRGEVALHHGKRCAASCAAAGLVDFDLAYAHESTARALACLGRLDEAAAEVAAAKAVPIADLEDLAIVENEIATEPWFGLSRPA